MRITKALVQRSIDLAKKPTRTTDDSRKTRRTIHVIQQELRRQKVIR